MNEYPSAVGSERVEHLGQNAGKSLAKEAGLLRLIVLATGTSKLR